MEHDENLDLTEDLVSPVCECENHNGPAPETRSAIDLEKVAYEDMTEDERKYFISALKMRNKELDTITKKAFEENRRINELRKRDLTLMEDTLTFIKTEVGQCLGSVSLAIKNMEREVQKYGN